MSDEPQDTNSTVRANGVSPQQAVVDADDLQSSLVDLAALVAGTRGLTELLALVATYAAKAIPGADGAGVTLLWVDRPDNRVGGVGGQ